MMQYSPSIIVKRLVVKKDDQVVYDGSFSTGVNVIRGDNSSGKSTIADFIFYALGGELSAWKKEAALCDITYVEVELNGKTFVLKRPIKPSRAGMDIIESTYNKLVSSNFQVDWLRYPYAATDDKKSFYQALLQELEIPLSAANDHSNITLHQLLRLMYVDQMTSLDRLFKFDKFDNANKRRAVGELLIGLSDVGFYELRMEQQAIEKKLKNYNDEIKILESFLSDDIAELSDIEGIIRHKENSIEEIEKFLESASFEKEDNSEENRMLLSKRENIIETRDKLIKLKDSESNIRFEIMDSRKFIHALERRIEHLSNSSKTIDALSNISFKYCPSCFSPVGDKAGNDCCLCKSNKSNNNDRFDPTFKIRQEIEFQISESKKIIEIREAELEKLNREINSIGASLEGKQVELRALEQPCSTVSQKQRECYIKIGAYKNEIVELAKTKARFSSLYSLYDNRNNASYRHEKVKKLIKRKEIDLDSRIKKKKDLISQCTMRLIKADMDHEEAFNGAMRIDFDFGEDRVSIDDRVLFSASSMVYLKNAFRLGLLHASCIDPTFLYPRFILMDNIEDKGMQPERSHIFQQEIIKLSKNIKVSHQIIFTTSMIDPEINDSQYCVGDFYSDTNKSLKFN